VIYVTFTNKYVIHYSRIDSIFVNCFIINLSAKAMLHQIIRFLFVYQHRQIRIPGEKTINHEKQ